MTNYSSSDREVIRYLFSETDWCDLYQMHLRFSLSPAQVLDIIERLVGAGFAEADGLKSRLTKDGREWVLAARGDIFFGSGEVRWKNGDEKAEEVGNAWNMPYLPDISLLEREFFLKLALDKSADSATH